MAHVRRWQVEVFLFEGDPVTSATAVLHGDDGIERRATATTRRAPEDPSVPEVGDEIAVARALQELAEELLRSGEEDLAAVEAAGHS
jgi:hypothetical protein